MIKKIHPLFIGTALCLLAALLYLPGLSGPWLVDDEVNLGVFLHHTPDNAPYAELIFGNNSGPLGRSVAMASFALNHALGLFSTSALKATGVLFHIANGAVLFALLLALFRKRSPIPAVSSLALAALLTAWWLLLPLHTSTVLYIVQRMTQVATFFSLLTCLTWVVGRTAQQAGALKKAGGLLLISLFIFFPLAIFAKESAFSTLAWLLLIELFFFSTTPVWRIGIRPALSLLLLITVALGTLLAFTAYIQNGYLGREFSLAERLLTEPRILWTYISDIFLPNNQHMGLFHDDIIISKSWLIPWTTLPALVAVLAALGLSVYLANTRWWAVALGILLYFSGHLIESTLVALELYFEHRNYLPSIGLLLAAATAVFNLWPWRKRLLLLVFALYIGLLSFSTLQRSHIWGDKDLLLETSAINHPHSLRAWSDYTESLLAIEGKGGKAALETALFYANNNPDFAGIGYLHMISLYCRLGAAPDAPLLQATAQQLAKLPTYYITPLSVGLQNIYENRHSGACANTDFTPLVAALSVLDQRMAQHYGRHYQNYWLLRFTIAQWQLAYHHQTAALNTLRSLWANGTKADIPTVGLTLAQALAQAGQMPELRQVLNELDAVTADAPPDFRATMAQLRQQTLDTP